jgi:hypothetical protein
MNTRLLVKFPGGYLQRAVTPAAGARIREGSLSVDVVTLGEAARIAVTLLYTMREPALEITAVMEPRGGDVPFVDFVLGDEVTVPNVDGTPVAARVVGMTLTFDSDGQPIYVPEFDIGHEVA